MTSGPLVGLLVLVACLGSVDAADAPRRRKGFRLGRLHVTPRLQLKNAGVDTNVFQTLQDPVRDNVVVLSGRLDGEMPLGRRLRLTGYGFVDRNYYQREGQQRSTDFYGRGDAVLDLGRLKLTGGGGGGQFTQRYSIDVDERLTRQERRAEASAQLRLAPRLSATLQGSAEVVTFAPGSFRLGRSLKQALDRNTLVGGAQLRYALTNRTSLLVSAEALEDRFFSAPVGLPRLRRSYRYLGGFEVGESVSRRTPSGRLLVGMRDFPVERVFAGNPSYQGPVVAADVALPLGRFGRFRAEGSRDVQYASNLSVIGTLQYRNAFVYQRYLGEQQLPLPLQLVAFVSGGFEEARYLLPHPYLTPSFLARRIDHRWTWSAGLTRRFGDSVRLGGHVFFARRVSSLPLFSYEGLSYGLTAEVIP